METYCADSKIKKVIFFFSTLAQQGSALNYAAR